MILNKKRKIYIGAVATFAIAFLVGLFSFGSLGLLGGADADSSAQIRMGVREVISIAIDADDVSFGLTPEFADTKSGTFGMSSTTVKVYTNSDGYNLYMSNKDDSNNLAHENLSGEKISSILAGSTYTIDDTDSTDAFPVNSWGYSLDTGTTKTYSAIPTSVITLRSTRVFDSNDNVSALTSTPDTSGFTSTNGPDSDKSQTTDKKDYDKLITTTVTFGAKVDTSIASGSYKDIVVFDVTGLNVGPVAPSVTATTSWVKTATVTAQDDGPDHEIKGYEFIAVKSDKAYNTSDTDLDADAATRTPASNATVSGSITATKSAGAGTGGKDLYNADIIFSGNSATSTTGDAYDDGIYYVYIRSIDNLDKRSNWATAKIIKLDNTKPATPVINRTNYKDFTFPTSDNVAVTKYIAVPCVTSSSVSAQDCIDNATTPGLNDAAWDTASTASLTGSSTQLWLVYARDEAGNISDASTIESFSVTNYYSYDTNLEVRLDSATGTEIADGATAYALAGTPIYVNATTAGTLDYVCTSSSTTPCTTTNITNDDTFELTGNTYIFASSTVLGFGGVSKMQDMTPATCASANVGDTGKLLDTRDNKIYWAGKLGDNNCWMTQNLGLEGGQTIDSDKSNLAPGTSYTLPVSSTDFGTSNDALKMYNGSHTDGDHSSTGAYYNARVANALTDTESIVARNYTWSICPKGWTLPTNPQHSGITSYYDAFAPAFAGYYGSISLGGSGTLGIWWSRTAYSNTDFYYLYANTSALNTDNNTTRNGRSIRCIAKTDVTAPDQPTLTPTDHNSFSISSSADVVAYYIRVDDDDFDGSGYQTANTFDITQDGEHTYYVWAVDGEGNVSAPASLTTHTLTIKPAHTTVNVKFNNDSGAAVASDVEAETSVTVIDGVQLYIKVVPKNNYVLKTATFNSTDVLSNLDNGNGSYTGVMPSSNAVLEIATKPFNGIGEMQAMTPKICLDASVGDEAILKDTRDQKEYVVRKLGDGNCWMVQNLGLEGGQTLDSDKTNLAPGTTYALPASSESGFDLNSGQLNMYNGSHTDGDSTSTGAYYNGRVANTLTADEPLVTDKEYLYNICPKNWTLPTHIQQESVVSYADDFEPISDGHYYQGALDLVGSETHWWSRTAYSANTLQYMHSFNGGSELRTSTSRTISRGFNVRCVAQTDTEVPTKPAITRTAYNTFTFTSTDNSAVYGYYLKIDDGTFDNTGFRQPTDNSITIDQSAGHTYYVWAVDAVGNISERAEISSYSVERSTSYAALTTYRDAEAKPTAAADISAKSFTNKIYVLKDTPIWIEASPSAGYSIIEAKVNGSSLPLSFYNNRSATTNDTDKAGKYVLGSKTLIVEDTTIVVNSRPTLIQDVEYIQDITSTVCGHNKAPARTVDVSKNIDSDGSYTSGGGTGGSYIPQASVKDRRDGQSYLVRKLADGKCWMTQNMALGLGIYLTSTFSNVSSPFTTPSSNGITSGQQYASMMVIGSVEHGNYYSYTATTAGTSTSSITSGNLSYSICPKSWHLPSANEYTSFYSSYSNNKTIFAVAFNAQYSGYSTYGASASLIDRYALCWTSTVSNATMAMRYHQIVGDEALFHTEQRYVGQSVRCAI